jgi:thiaminase/transcriptional activator TenA
MSLFEKLKQAATSEWRAYTEHPFINAMADGTLPEPAFRHYLVQDYLFLIEFARSYALAAYKAPTLADMRDAAAAMAAILDVEMDLHVTLCAGWGLSPVELETAPAAAASGSQNTPATPIRKSRQLPGRSLTASQSAI